MTYNQALDISRSLRPGTRAAKLLDMMCEQTGRARTFIIMRYGDPHNWRNLPKPKDSREYRYRSKYTRLRPCHLVHIEGRSIRAKSIAEFCDKAGLKETHNRLHVSPVLNGERTSFKGWYRPEFLARKVELRDVYGNVTTHAVRDLIRNNRMKVTTIRRLLDGSKKSGLDSRIMLADTPVNAIMSPRPVRITKVKLTDGRKVYTGTSIPDAARKAGITNLAGLYSIAYGFRDDLNGMTIKDIELERRQVLEQT
jgi:hypothetical protein